MKKIKRRDFIKASAAFSSMMFLPSCATKRVRGANERMQVAVVGWGGQGFFSVQNLHQSKDAVITALCDVDDNRVKETYFKSDANKALFKAMEPVKKFRDYRVMLDKMDRDIDGVAVCTPDHSHYPICAWAISKGKHVFCEKPLTRTIWESRQLQKMAKDAGVYTQMGNQVHTTDGWRSIREWFDAGILGKVEDIYTWTNRDWGFDKMPAPDAKVPAGLDYNLWLNVAQYQPYSSKIVPFHWRGLRNFGTGSAGDMGCHFFDNPYSAFELGAPFKIVADALPSKDFSWPKASSIDMFFKNKYGVDGIVKLHWFDGGRKPKHIKGVDDAFMQDPRNNNCIFIVGEKQTMTLRYTGQDVRLVDRAAHIELKKSGKIPPKTIPRNKFSFNPQADWANAVVEGRMPESNFDYAAPFTELALLSMIACIHPQQELLYDAKNMSFSNYRDADKFTRSLYKYRNEFLPSEVRI